VPNRLRQALDSLRKEESVLQSQLGRVRDAIAALGATIGRPARKAGGARKRRGMTAAQKKAVSQRMKAYWAQRRKAKGSK
jgi:hypothetical protein